MARVVNTHGGRGRSVTENGVISARSSRFEGAGAFCTAWAEGAEELRSDVEVLDTGVCDNSIDCKHAW